jgi:hypothetical protein
LLTTVTGESRVTRISLKSCGTAAETLVATVGGVMTMHHSNQREGVSARRLACLGGAIAIGLILTAAAASPGPSCNLAASGPDGQPAAAEAGGWRLALSQPVAGGATAPVALLCYEVTGTSREPELALEITPMSPGAGPASATVRTGATVGRSSVTADLSGAGEGTYDLRVQLVVDGSTIERPAVMIRGVTLRHDAPRAVCSWKKAKTDHP